MLQELIKFVHSNDTELSQDIQDWLNSLSTIEHNETYQKVLDSIQSDRSHWSKEDPTLNEIKLINKINKIFYN